MNYNSIEGIGLPSLQQINDVMKNVMKFGGDSFQLFKEFQERSNFGTTDRSLSVDPYGCEKLFVIFFIKEELEDDFPLIVRDFLKHGFEDIDQDFIDYVNIDNGDLNPSKMFYYHFLSVIVNAANRGSEYAKALLLNLYKTYYKKEYKTFKKFSVLTQEDLLALAEVDDDNRFFHGNLARILYIARLSGITISSDCEYIYAYLNYISERYEKLESHSLDLGEGELFQEAKKYIEDNYDIDELYKLQSKEDKFSANVSKWLCYNPIMVDMCDVNYDGFERSLAITLVILKKTYPSKGFDYSAEELVRCSSIVHFASAMASNLDWMAERLYCVTYGEETTDFYDSFPSKFNPEDIVVGKTDNKPRTVIDKTKARDSVVADEIKDDLISELESLKRKLHMLESANGSLRSDLQEKKKLEEERKQLINELEGDKRELSALRSFVYSHSNDDVEQETDISIQDMKKHLSGLRIVIIGGHPNWVSKLKREFPDWVYVNPEASGTTDASIVENADKVFFFTSVISHTKYYQFINILRERKITFAYLDGVNIERNIRDIYKEVEK